MEIWGVLNVTKMWITWLIFVNGCLVHALLRSFLYTQTIGKTKQFYNTYHRDNDPVIIIL